jgi:class 3 adenylate cyclase/tetratricopeptide (TPR) repeat protein
VTCPTCSTENEPGRKFCRECGTPLALVCSNCGASNDAGAKFCGECGTALLEGVRPAAAPPAASPVSPTPTAERRLVSVLFADLVGFTSLSESRDAEEVREMLSRYFDTSRQVIARYGGTIEKFIGDAVMAVWGTPVTREDDAERAVRAALELTTSVADLGTELGVHELRARAGVLTGEAAVTLGAEGQGMVAGDLVNTASRIQSTAEPGQVLVGDATYGATQAAVAYEDAGVHELKGKAEPVQLWRALRVVAGARGALRSQGIEAPFVGRDRELRQLKDLFHATWEEGKAHLLSVTGVAGIGKSRLGWEFFKYIDGLADTVYWHRGRCLPYGDGVAFWALAEMVRMRARIAEEEDPDSAMAKLREVVEAHIPEEDERQWILSRLAHLLGLEDQVPRAGTSSQDAQDLFAAWRRFFERLTETYPVAMVFEDIQWADMALLDFVEYLLDWSKNHPLFVVTLARPELSDRRPTWGAARRNATSLFLEPLTEDAVDRMILGLVPGLPDTTRDAIRERAEGVPLYAVETVRMLLDRGLLRQEGSRYVPTGPIEELAVPESLHALIAARLDGLPELERRVVQEASVLGKTFTRGGLAALTGVEPGDLDPVLTSLVRKEMFGVQQDPRSPEHGQYGFLQSLARKVAYDTMSKHDRKARHLAVARYLEESWGADDDEIVQVVASHYLDAFQAAPEAADAAEIKSKARETLVRAARRGQSLAAHDEAGRYFVRAAELTDHPAARARLLESAGEEIYLAGRPQEAADHFQRAIDLFEAESETHAAARVSGRLGIVEWWDFHRIDEAVERVEAAFAQLSGEVHDPDVAFLAAEAARLHYFRGEAALAFERAEFALRAAEWLGLPEVLSQAMNTKALTYFNEGRLEEGRGLLLRALDIAIQHDLPAATVRAYTNLSVVVFVRDDYEESERIQREAIAVADRYGMRGYRWFLAGHLMTTLWKVGRWDEAVGLWTEVSEFADAPDVAAAREVMGAIAMGILGHQGKTEAALEIEPLFDPLTGSTDVQAHALERLVRSVAARLRGDPGRAIGFAEETLETMPALGIGHASVRDAIEAMLDLLPEARDPVRSGRLFELIADLGPGGRAPAVNAQVARAKARIAAAEGGDPLEIHRNFGSAAAIFEERSMRFWLAITRLDWGEWLMGQGREDEARPLLEQARDTFQRLGAAPSLERVEVLLAPEAASAAGAVT